MGKVCVHLENDVGFDGGECVSDTCNVGCAETLFGGTVKHVKVTMVFFELLHNTSRAVGTGIVNDEHVKMRDRERKKRRNDARDVVAFIVGRQDDARTHNDAESRSFKSIYAAQNDMHILMVSEYFPPRTHGGGETSGLALARALVAAGHRVSVLTSGTVRSVLEIDGVTVYQYLQTGETSNSFWGNVRRLFVTKHIRAELPVLVERLKPDVVHALNITSMPGVASVLRSKGMPLVAHINSPLAFDPKGTLTDGSKARETPYSFWSFVWSFLRSGSTGRLANPWYLRCNPLAWVVFYARWARIRDSLSAFDYFFPISATMRRWLHVYGVPLAKTAVLPNIVLVASDSDVRTNKVPRLFYDGGYAPLKGLHVVLDALKGVRKPYELVCVGAGPDRAKLEEQARVNGVRATFLGFVSEQEHVRWVASSDIVLFPSQVPEGLGRLALIGMAAGKPVIASRIGGLAETVLDEITGLLVEPTNVRAWQDALVDLLEHPDKRVRMGAAGKERFLREFSAESIVKKAITGYKTVLQQNSRP